MIMQNFAEQTKSIMVFLKVASTCWCLGGKKEFAIFNFCIVLLAAKINQKTESDIDFRGCR